MEEILDIFQSAAKMFNKENKIQDKNTPSSSTTTTKSTKKQKTSFFYSEMYHAEAVDNPPDKYNTEISSYLKEDVEAEETRGNRHPSILAKLTKTVPHIIENGSMFPFHPGHECGIQTCLLQRLPGLILAALFACAAMC